MMKNLICPCLILCLFCHCGSKQAKIEKYMEDGVEVVVNHIEPYKLASEPTHLYLEEEFRIDTEKEDIMAIGLTDINYINVDSEGSIYCLNEKCQENFILKFDWNGNFVTAFGRKGQGPGELQMPILPLINSQDEVVVMDQGRRELFFFTKDGTFIKSISRDASTIGVFPLENGNYLMATVIIDPQSDNIMEYPFSVFSSDFKEIKELDRLKFPNYLKGRKQKATPPGFLLSVTPRNVYFGNEEQGYEIRMYDLEGNLVRKIKKEYRKVRIPEEYIEEQTEGMSDALRQRIYFPEYFPPFQCAFPDDKERLYVITNEKGNNPGAYMCDIFNPAGIFITRTSLAGVTETGLILLPPIARNDRLYCIEEKESGYRELVVYKMKWE